MATLRDQLKEDPAGNWEKIANLAREEQALSRRIETMMSEWSSLNDELAREATSSPNVKAPGRSGSEGP